MYSKHLSDFRNEVRAFIRHEPPSEEQMLDGTAELTEKPPDPPVFYKKLMAANRYKIPLFAGSFLDVPIGYLYYISIIYDEESEFMRIKRLQEKLKHDWEQKVKG